MSQPLSTTLANLRTLMIEERSITADSFCAHTLAEASARLRLAEQMETTITTILARYNMSPDDLAVSLRDKIAPTPGGSSPTDALFDALLAQDWST